MQSRGETRGATAHFGREPPALADEVQNQELRVKIYLRNFSYVIKFVINRGRTLRDPIK